MDASISRWVTEKAASLRITDALVNIMTGLGTSRDKTAYSAYSDFTPLTPAELDTLFASSALARKAVMLLVDDALRKGFRVVREGAEPGEYRQEAAEIEERLKALGLRGALTDAAWKGRLFGAAGIVLGVRGAGPLTSELDPTKVTAIEFVRADDRQNFTPAKYGPDGSVTVWNWTRTSVRGGHLAIPTVQIHDSRILWLYGAATTDRGMRTNGGWSHSVLDPLKETLIAYDSFWSSIDSQVVDASQAVFHLSGFIDALASNSGETGDALRKRLALMDISRSSAKALVLDAGDATGAGREDFQVIERGSLAAMDRLVSTYLNRFAAAAGYPVSVLFGQAAAGTNATGESDLILHFQAVDIYRESALTAPAEKMVRLVAQELGIADPEEWCIEWPELWTPKPLDVASAEKMRVDAAIGLVSSGVALAEEIALSLGRIAPSLGLVLDAESRLKALEGGLAEVEERTLEADPETPTASGVSSGRSVRAQVNPAAAKNSPK
jgi:phage-related protein (TIGR01555 family)